MAAAYAVILSSSPARGLIATTPPSTAQHAIPSSPGLPSLSEILAEKMPRPPNQNKTIAVPDTTTDFTSARSLPRKEDVTQPLNAQRQLGLAGYNHGLDVGGTKADAEKSRTERNKSEHAKVLRTSKSSSTPKLSGDTVGAENEVNHENMIDSGRKKRMKKPKKDDQTKIMKAKVTKPRSSSNSSKHPKKVCTGSIRAIVDNQCDIEAAIDGEENKSGAYNEPDLGLIEALRRRRDWTPARDTLRDS
ncbi:MAG: hypothetical protein L6R42_010082, partial [Xanthoria sp. 1 TBL-2021]